MDTPKEACGIFGVYAPGQDVARITFFGLFALQHRGQESAGIAVSNGEEVAVYKQMGLVSQVFDEEILSRLRGHLAIGHTRYSTTGSSVIRNAQPILVNDGQVSLALGHNGNLLNALSLRTDLEAEGIVFRTTSDSEIMARLLHRELALGALPEEALRELALRVHGAYSLVILTQRALMAVRDPYGLRPLCVGELVDGEGYVVASETAALHVVGARLLREVEAGEALVVDEGGLRWLRIAEHPRPSLCIFEYIYFARPDSYLYGISLHTVRRRLGNELAREHPVEADVVIPVPDTGIPAAIGYSEVSGIPFGEGLIKNRYIHRTFIQPDQRLRQMGVKMKLSPLRETLEGRRVVMVDDSIVRGTTTGHIVRLLREAGAREVHVRISSPPIRWPCYYGIDMATKEELIAANHSVEEIRRHIGADTLGYLSLEGLQRAVGLPAERFCRACFEGQYPIPLTQEVVQEGKRRLERTMQPVAEAR